MHGKGGWPLNDPYRKVRPGDRLKIPAQTWNSAIDRAKAYRRSGGAIGGGSTPRSGWIVPVRNDTGADVGTRAVLGIGGPIFLPSDSLDAFKQGVTFRGVTPEASHADRFVVTLGPIPAGQVGRAFVAGVYQVQVNVLDESHTCAHAVEDDVEKLESGSGPAQIIWKESGTGTKWALVRRVGVCRSVPSVCETTINVSVSCGATAQSGVAVTVSRGGVTLDTCTTNSLGQCSLSITGAEDVEVTVPGAARTITPNCSTQSVAFVGEDCSSCLSGGPATLTLNTPYGSFTLNQTLGGYNCFGTVPDVPDVIGVDCSVTPSCTGPKATRTLTVLYEFACSFFGNSMTLSMRPQICTSIVSPFPQEFVECTTPGTGGNSIFAYSTVKGYSFDSIDFGGSCVPCGDTLEFVIDYSGLGGEPGLCTIEGL